MVDHIETIMIALRTETCRAKHILMIDLHLLTERMKLKEEINHTITTRLIMILIKG